MWWNDYGPEPWMFLGPMFMMVIVLICVGMMFFMMRGHRHGHADLAGQILKASEPWQVPALRHGAGAGRHALWNYPAHDIEPHAYGDHVGGDGGADGGGDDDEVRGCRTILRATFRAVYS